MQVSFVISSVLHVAILGLALFSFDGPQSLNVADVEAVPVSIIPFEDITQVVQGDEEANNKNTPAPTPTESQRVVEDAQNVGSNDVDLNSVDVPIPSNNEVVSQAPPKAEPDPAPAPEPEVVPEPVREITPQEPSDSTAATEIAALPQEAAPAEADPVADAIKTTEAAAAPEERVTLPKTGPVPVFRPQVAPATTAKSPERKVSEVATNNSATARESDFNSDEIASLLNRQDSQGGGAKTSQREAGLGADTNRSSGTLSQSEMDALRGQIQSKWNIIPGLADGGDIKIRVSMQLDRSGQIVGQPDVSATGGSEATRRTLASSARRAVLRAQPYDLPAEKFDTWSQVVVNFDPSELF